MFQRLLNWLFNQSNQKREYLYLIEKQGKLISDLKKDLDTYKLQADFEQHLRQDAEKKLNSPVTPRYVELPAFDESDSGYIEAIAAMVKPELWFFLESLRRDAYDQIMAQSDEKLMVNAAQKAKGIELVMNRFELFGRLAREESEGERG